ncbi:MAG TPA: FAD-binding oxidoreductase, partial [Candidatus Deferrimicrobiaceae bacterium]|nr:FAD-binding oxidoreductase [Candidatus Deferrimicrobiaceae bacterium]
MSGPAPDVIVVGAGVHGASLAFHLARRGATVLVVESGAIAGGATGRSSGFVRMHYDLEVESRLAHASLPYFTDWEARVGHGDPGFVQTGFLQLVPEAFSDALRANVETHRRIGIRTSVVGPDEIARLVPDVEREGLAIGAYEPDSGYADPTGTAAGFVAAARAAGATYLGGCRVSRIVVEDGRVVGIDSDRGRFEGDRVVIAAGAWATTLGATAGVELPVQAWRHDTAYFGLPEGRTADLPIVIDHGAEVYFRPEGRELLLVGLEAGNVVGGSPDRPYE